MKELVLNYNELRLENGQTAVFPLKPFGPGFVMDQAARQAFQKDGFVLGLIAPWFVCLFPPLLVVSFAIYYFMAWRRGGKRVPPMRARRWAEIQGCERPAILSLLGIALCTLGAGTGGWLVSLSFGWQLATLVWLLLLGSCLAGMYQTWMLKARWRTIKREP